MSLTRGLYFYVQQFTLKRFYVQYTQGQSLEQNIREYFYYIDHQGMMTPESRILHLASKFLVFFFKRLKPNTTDRYPAFPFLSPCGRERNYIRCDDCPIVFCNVQKADGQDMFCYNHADTQLSVPFQPNKIYMDPYNGRIYHPGPECGGRVGLVMSKLAVEFSKSFDFESSKESPSHFTWNGVKYKLDSNWYDEVRK